MLPAGFSHGRAPSPYKISFFFCVSVADFCLCFHLKQLCSFIIDLDLGGGSLHLNMLEFSK